MRSCCELKPIYTNIVVPKKENKRKGIKSFHFRLIPWILYRKSDSIVVKTVSA